ncbi:iron ABC transporter permease [Pseudovibrio sp. Tun.PSC04-5.I4]|uniref:FecCD family ABC transporter permease n=1 Tax=Pseudovibrio sp. Tun.PSC04-5.I4 TaxID=1798213 RepID=UPI0008913A81|nr:iron ABC transporter permease [Pseudovibrio sp. Tun.PSC04-5.I4]SDQ86411.1 iron complex transport system permease protein [Pseudovibrio sp. Tun.PSC04-5.I4]
MPFLAMYWSLMGVALLCGAALSLATGGRQDIGFYQVLGAIFSQLDEQSLTVLRDIRVPRTLIAALIGANLSLAGLLLQATTRNPLSSPSILGINQGAALGIAIGLVFPSLMIFNVDTMAVLGAALAGGVTLTLAGGFKGTLSALRLILSGVAVSAFAFALVRFTFTLDDELARSIILWTTGDISDVRWKQASPLLLWCVGGSVITFFMSHKLNLMALGEAASKGLGSDPRFTLFLGILLAAILTGVSVATAGPVMFVGLIIPHLCRAAFGTDHRVLVPAVIVGGASLMLMADGVSKLINFPEETAVGVVSALIGAPYFLYLTITAKEID